MSENKIAIAINKLFTKHRIVFWYDAKQELHDEFEALTLPEIEKVVISNNEFALKHRILRQEQEQKFLIYHKGPKPEDLDNWLLDVQLANGEFRADQVAMWLSELELGLEFASVVENHTEFYKNTKRKEKLKSLLKIDDTQNLIRLKMLAVCADSDPQIDSIVETLLKELSEDDWSISQDGKKLKLIKQCKLIDFLWVQMKRHYGYEASEPSIKDFVIQLFKDNYFLNFHDDQVKTKKPLSTESLIFLKRWKDSRLYEDCFETLSANCAEVLNIEQDLGRRDFRTLMSLDYFELIDRKIISELVKSVVALTVTKVEVEVWVRQRRQSHWFSDKGKNWCDLYQAIEFAAQFMHDMVEAKLNMEDMADGVKRYSKFWYRLDQCYRKFTYHVLKSSQTSLMSALSDKIENLYANKYLLKVNDNWQVFVDQTNKWDAGLVLLQRNFYRDRVKPILTKNNKVCVIISDALRYEVGQELLSLIRKEDRFDADLEAALSMLPSYTQLGMAALLPNEVLTLAENDTGTVLVDGKNSAGTENRIKILAQIAPKKSTALKSEDLLALKIDECRTIVKENDIVYIYHNRIDATGDKMVSEGRVFEAVEETLQELLLIVKKLTNSNVNNLFITSDHGFLYQHRAIEESDFISGKLPVVAGQQVNFLDRRFILGKNLEENSSLRKFTSAQLGLEGKMEVQIPKSIKRLRLSGSGSRFVHGGASLQEIIIPVISINKKRSSDTTAVDVEILRGSSSLITSSQLVVVFYQSQPVTDKVQSRTLKAGIFNKAGELISDSHELTFDYTSDNPRNREQSVCFVLTRKSDEAKNQEVSLKLEEKLPGTTHYTEYKSSIYTVRISFTSDFDF